VPSGAGYAPAENIATASSGLATAAQTAPVSAGQPDHRANILKPDFRDTGWSAAAAVPAGLLEGLPGTALTEEFKAIVRPR
jgi:hypothetical protein